MTFLRTLFLAVAATFSLAACSDAADLASGGVDIDPTAQLILDKLEGARSDLEYTNIEPSPIAGYYQVQVGGSEIIYVSEDAEHFFLGQLYAIQPGQFVDVTEKDRAAERLVMLANLDPDTLIIFPADGEIKAVISVFTDVTCGFCRKLHEEIAEINAAGIEVHYLAYPRSGIERNGVLTHEFTETVKAWCADDRADALTRLKMGEMMDIEVCDDNPVADHYALGRQFGVTGTPALVLPDGTLSPGYRPTAELARILGISD